VRVPGNSIFAGRNDRKAGPCLPASAGQAAGKPHPRKKAPIAKLAQGKQGFGMTAGRGRRKACLRQAGRPFTEAGSARHRMTLGRFTAATDIRLAD